MGALFPSVLSVGYTLYLVTTLREPDWGTGARNDTRRNTEAPATKRKVIKAQTEGEPPSAPQKRGEQWGRAELGAHKGIGVFKIFFLIFFY